MPRSRFRLRPRFPRRLALLLLAGAPACATMPPENWALALRPDFSSPEAAGRTFLSAWSVEEMRTEYLALAEDWKAEVGGTLDAYLIARPHIADQVGWVGSHAWRLEPLRTDLRPDGTRIVWWGLPGGTPRVGLEMVAQHYLEFEGADGQRPGSYLTAPPEQWIGFEGALFWMEVEDASVRSAARLDGIRRVELGTEWKIRGLLAPEEPADP